MKPIAVTDINAPELAPFAKLTEAQLRSPLRDDGGIFIAESPKVISVALDAGYEPVSLLCEEGHISGDAAPIIARMPDIPIYTGPRKVLAQLTGYTLTRGVLCAMKRKPLPSPELLCRDASRVVVIDGVSDTTNIGSIFRSAAALGIDGVILTPTSCDPLNRRSVRVSMGSVFLVPWTRLEAPVAHLKIMGFSTIALALRDDSVSISDPRLKEIPKAAMIVGTEGDGLADEVISAADYVALIPMHHKVDSLNVGAAAAVAFWELSKRKP